MKETGRSNKDSIIKRKEISVHKDGKQLSEGSLRSDASIRAPLGHLHVSPEQVSRAKTEIPRGDRRIISSDILAYRPHEIATKQIFPGHDESEHHEHEPNTSNEAWANLNSYFAEQPLYSTDSNITTYAQGRLDYISSGRKAELVVVHDETPQAFATPGYVVVSDGLLKLVEYQEEFDAVLGHEWEHLEEGHVHDQGGSNASTIEMIGSKRRHEIEADFKPFEKLDAKGINPAGMMSIFKKLENWQEAHRGEHANIFSGDVVHGSFLDRRLNLEEATWLIDVRNLSTEFTPVQFASDDFEGYEDTASLIGRFGELSLIEKRRLVERECNDIVQESDTISFLTKMRRSEKVIAMQKEVLKEADPELSEQDTLNLSLAVISHSYGSSSEMEQLMDNAGIPFDTWISQFDTEDKIRDFFTLFERDSLSSLGISLKKDTFDVGSTAEKIFTAFLASQDRIDIPGYVKLVQDTHIVVPADYEKNRPANIALYYEPMIKALETRGAAVDVNLKVLGEALVDAPFSLLPTYDQNNNMVMYHVYETDRDILQTRIDAEYHPYNEVFGHMFKSRVAQLRTVTEPFDVLEHIVDKFPYVKGTPGPIDIIDTTLRSKLLHARNAASIPDILDELQTRYGNNSDTVPNSHFLNYLAHIYHSESFEKSEGLDTSQRINIENLSERFLLWSVCAEPDQYLHMVNEDIDRLSGKSNLSKEIVKQISQTAIAAPERAGVLGMPIEWRLETKDLTQVDNLMELLNETYKSELMRGYNPAVLIEMVKIIPDVKLEEGVWDTLATKILEDRKILNKVDGLEKLFALGLVAENTQIVLQVPRRAAEAIVEKLNFGKGMEFIFEKYADLPRHIFADALAHIIEHKAKSAEDFEKLETALRREIAGFLGNDKLMGESAVIDTFILDPYRAHERKDDKFDLGSYQNYGMEPSRLFDAILQSGASDEQLKRYLLGRWWHMSRIGGDREVANHFNVETAFATFRHPGKEARFEHWSREVPPQYLSLSKMVADVYLATNPMKYALLRKTLTGQGGVLSTDTGRSHFVESFISDKVDLSSGEGAEMVTTLLSALVSVGEQEELYQQLNPILTEMVLNVPQEPYAYKDLAVEVGKNLLTEIHNKGLIRNPTERDKIALQRKMYKLMTGGASGVETETVTDNATKLLSLFAEDDKNGENAPLSPWELGITIGEKSQAVGTRMLQLAGQFFNVPEEYADRVRGAFDSSKGQTRLQMYRVMRREAEVVSPIAEMMENIAEIGPRIGGGSLMSVNKVFMVDGSVEAVAVRNPNVEYNLGKIVNLAQRTIQRAQEIDPENKNYKLLGVLLSDVQEWVHNELYDPEFEVKDAEFRERHDSATSELDRGNNRYSILVPKSKPTGTRWVRRDEYIEGKNLTGLKVIDEGQTDIPSGLITKKDFKDAVSLLAKDAVSQLEHGLVHSDFHPGNFRITEDNTQIAVFDRYNLLRLDAADKNLINGMVGALAQGDARSAQHTFVDYLFELETNQEIAGKKEEIKQVFEQLEIENSSTPDDILMDTIFTLKQQGVKVPLKISLIGRNLQAITQMSEQAGFNGLLGALMHS